MQTLTTRRLNEMRQGEANFELINVLPQDNFEKQHIPGSKNIPATDDAFVQKVEQAVGDKDRDVVVYCANESCDMSPKAAKKLESAGFKSVYDYEGGTKAWREAGLPIEGTESKQTLGA